MKLSSRIALMAIVAVAALAAPSAALALGQNADEGTWQAGGKVFAMARVGNTLFIGGQFNKLLSPDGSQQRAAKGLAAIDMTTGAPVEGWSATTALVAQAPVVRSLGVSPDGSRLYVGGHFDTLDGAAVKNFGAVTTATGGLAPGFAAPRVAGQVHAILVGPSRIYIGGAFSTVSNKPRSKVAAVDATGALDPVWQPVANDTVRSLAMAADGLTVFIGGHFTQMNNENRQSVARVDATTGANNLWQIPPGVINTPQTAWSILPNGNRLVIGFGEGPNYVAAFHLDFGSLGSQIWRFDTVGNVESLALNGDGTRLFGGGHFGTARLQQTVCGNIPLHGLMSMNPATGQLFCDWFPAITPYGSNFTGAWTMLSTGTQLWVGGLINAINGVPHRGFARFTL
jgi:hypothetical protein